ncbi:hypothetical protein EU537_12075 [Candidatus Thorarchaeota archaeon]|nr:MAG: hypothetical protein EU537_12075 [Candidatus Thorarchaeota archaeon]
MVRECWKKKILRIDLSEKSTKVDKIPTDILDKFIGGKGIGTYFIYKELKEGINPLGPDNILYLLSGPLQGLPAPNVGRWSIVTKSPKTGLYLDSHIGGAVGREVKRSGYDVVAIKGRADKPVALVIEDDLIRFESAQHLWGLGVYEATPKLHEMSGSGSSVYAIGPAGERLLTNAVGCCEIAHQSGRGGIGAVLGSKNLKGVVANGTQKISAHDVDTIREINARLAKGWKERDVPFKRYGTTFLPEISNELGQYPTRNFRSGYFEEVDALNAEKIKEKYGLGNHHSCPHCVMRCTHAFETENPLNPAEKVESMVEYETLGLMGSNLGISDPRFVFKLNYICDDYGMDTISTGGIIGFAMELYEQGILTEDDIGFKLPFGNGDNALKLAKMIAEVEGIGEILSKGVETAAEEIGNGSENYAVHVKGLEVPAWDPRGRRGMGLSYATADIGASHLRGWPATTEAPNESAVDLVESMVDARNEKILTDSLEVCHFTYHLPMPLDDKIDALNAATGLKYDRASIMEFGRRIETLTRLFNVREGINRENDILPKRFWEPEISGPREGMASFVSREDFEKSLDRYYEIQGWNDNGVPTDESLRELGIAGLV